MSGKQALQVLFCSLLPCMVTPGIHCSDSSSSPDVLGWPSDAVLSTEDVTLYLHQCEHPASKLVLSMTKSSAIIVLLQILNKREQQFSFFHPFFFFDVGRMYFWRACCEWRDYFLSWDYLQKNNLCKKLFQLGISLWTSCGSFNSTKYWFQTDCHWSGAMTCLVRVGSSCGSAWWTCSCFAATWLPGYTHARWSTQRRKWDFISLRPLLLLFFLSLCVASVCQRKCLVENWKYNMF